VKRATTVATRSKQPDRSESGQLSRPREGSVAEADLLDDALERSLVSLILVLRRDGDAIEEVAIAEQRREDRDRFSPAGHFRDVVEPGLDPVATG